MSATTIAQPTTPHRQAQLPPPLHRRPRNAYQAWGPFSGSVLLALATQLKTGAGPTALMIAGFVTAYLNCHAIAHYLAGRLLAFASAATASGAPTIPRSIRPGSAS